MGHSTNFEGSLKFKNELTSKHLAYISKFLGEDIRDIEDIIDKDFGKEDNFYHLDVELTNEFDGLKWNGTEKCNDMPEIINFILHHMKMEFPDFDFSMTGKMAAQGEGIDDRWIAVFEDGKVVRKNLQVTGTRIRCSKCESVILVDDCEVVEK